MSEYQFVHFLAQDQPLDERQLDFMREQSTRAEISAWEFTNEYHFGDFRGDAKAMLRRGYDLHLHYANFGIRTLMFRLPGGLPCDRQTFKRFAVEDCVRWHADKAGKGGILETQPEADAGTFDRDLYDLDARLPKLAPLREMLIGGDLRPLYLAWLATAYDEDSQEPPVPAGLGEKNSALAALAGFYELSGDLIAAAAEASPGLPSKSAGTPLLTDWVARQSQDDLRGLVERLLGPESGRCRAEALARIRDETPAAPWPVASAQRTLGQLRALADQLHEKRSQRETQKRAAARRKRLAEMAADPGKAIAGIEELVGVRSTQSYEQAAQELADLREALGPADGPAQARVIALKLKKNNPRRNMLISALRKQELLD